MAPFPQLAFCAHVPHVGNTLLRKKSRLSDLCLVAARASMPAFNDHASDTDKRIQTGIREELLLIRIKFTSTK